MMEGVIPPRRDVKSPAPALSVTFIVNSRRFVESTPEGAYAFVLDGRDAGCVRRFEAIATYADGARAVVPGILLAAGKPPTLAAGKSLACT